MPTSRSKPRPKAIKPMNELPEKDRNGEASASSVEAMTYRVIDNPHKKKFPVRFRCSQCCIEVEIEGVIYGRPNCARCHVPMARVRT